jgi:hypothetical protein
MISKNSGTMVNGKIVTIGNRSFSNFSRGNLPVYTEILLLADSSFTFNCTLTLVVTNLRSPDFSRG